MTVGVLQDTVILNSCSGHSRTAFGRFRTVLKGMQNQMPDQQRSSPVKKQNPPRSRKVGIGSMSSYWCCRNHCETWPPLSIKKEDKKGQFPKKTWMNWKPSDSPFWPWNDWSSLSIYATARPDGSIGHGVGSHLGNPQAGTQFGCLDVPTECQQDNGNTMTT